MKSVNLVLMLVVFAGMSLQGCTTQSVLPETENIKVVREKPRDCTELGKVNGTTMYATDEAEDALNDLKKMAADKGATHVHVMEYSGHRTSVTGMAYQCR